MEDLVIGIDLGATNIKVGLVTADGRVLSRRRLDTEVGEGPEAVAGRICRACRELVSMTEIAPGRVLGAGVGCPGSVDSASGVLLFWPNVPDWRNVPLRRMIQDELGMRCVMDNDANVAALAEQWVGAGKGASSLVVLTLGTGIGAGIVLDGRVWRGGNGAAGEVGHMSINPRGPLCSCGNRGCLQLYASAPAMVRRMREAIEAGAPTSLVDRKDELTAELIHKAALAGDGPSRRNIEQTGRYLGVGVSNLMHILNPEVIAFSGGVTAAGEMLMAPLRDEVKRRTLEASRRGTRICFAALLDDAGVIGAARCFMIG